MERRDGRHPNHPEYDPVEREEMFQYIWEGRRVHRPFALLAEELGISATTAKKIFHTHKYDQRPPAVERDRLMDLEQVEEALERTYALLDLCKNDVELNLKVLETLRRLLKDKRDIQGTNAAKKFEIKETRRTEFDEKLEELERQLGLDRAPQEAQRAKARGARRARFDS